MEPAELLESLRTDTAALLDAARRADPSARVPCCPDWSTDDLVWHVGEVFDFWGAVVRDRLDGWESYVQPPRPDTFEATLALAERSAAALVDALAATPAGTPVWTWTEDRTAGWVLRRMAHESAVHRVDAAHAAGEDWRIPTATAADGIDEFLTWFLPQAGDDAAPLGGSVHLHCTDTGDDVPGEWTVRPGEDGGEVVSREHAKGDAAIRGPAHDLLMVLWRRTALDAGTVEVLGDAAVAERFVARAGLD